MNRQEFNARTQREQAALRRLDVAKALRENPDVTNIELAEMFDVDRDTIAADRKALMEQLANSSTNELELLRDDLRLKLEKLEEEVELHRKDGKLSLGAIDQQLSITKAIIELTGARKPVSEKLELKGVSQPVKILIGNMVGPGLPCVPKPGDKIFMDRSVHHLDGTTTHPDGETADGQVVIEQHHEQTPALPERDELLLTDGEQKIWDAEIEKKEPPAPSTEKYIGVK